MVFVQASVARPPTVNAPDEADREKEFFTTWIRLMERQKDIFNFTQELQKLLDQPKDMSAIVQDAKHQANMMSANAKTSMELVKRLNEFFFRDIVPALKRAKQVETIDSAQQQDSLDQYLEHGDEEETMPQEFVDDMSGWAAPPRQEKDHQKASTDGEDNEDNQESDDEIGGEIFHDMLISNGLKLTARQGPDYSALMQASMTQQQAVVTPNTVTHAAGARTNASSSAATGRGKVIANKRSRMDPPPIVTDLPPRPASAGSTQSRNPAEVDDKKDRIGKRTAANLIAEHVLDVRQYGSAREYYIRWKGVASPLWISRRKAPPQAKQLIDDYLRARGASLSQGAMDQTRRASLKGKKKTSRHGSSLRQGQQHTATENNSQAQGGEFYTVDHIVNHRLYYNRRQYLVRWENYDESDDTWENADKLHADVPDIVDAYEVQLQRHAGRAEALQSAMSELNRDNTTGSKSATNKRSIEKVGTKGAANKSNTHVSASGRINGERSKEKRRRIKEGTRKDAGGENNDQFALEEAELEEFSDDEFADNLNN